MQRAKHLAWKHVDVIKGIIRGYLRWNHEWLPYSTTSSPAAGTPPGEISCFLGCRELAAI